LSRNLPPSQLHLWSRNRYLVGCQQTWRYT
jgi:hypothetical protein